MSYGLTQLILLNELDQLITHLTLNSFDYELSWVGLPILTPLGITNQNFYFNINMWLIKKINMRVQIYYNKLYYFDSENNLFSFESERCSVCMELTEQVNVKVKNTNIQ
ncbi:F15O4.18 [Arabidopsis thaliana]|uniref:F15O4.18 n=1 Tax=Arabidopsis thaliana TaxID=3702 RepID=Q9LQG7_ARATH|nr:F15O4.18 [Arabidopsis thaliana]